MIAIPSQLHTILGNQRRGQTAATDPEMAHLSQRRDTAKCPKFVSVRVYTAFWGGLGWGYGGYRAVWGGLGRGCSVLGDGEGVVM